MWDIPWLVNQGAQLDVSLVLHKVSDYGVDDYLPRLNYAISEIDPLIASRAFPEQMKRFLPPSEYRTFFGTAGYERYLSNTIGGLLYGIQAALVAPDEP